jgi:hypothetical protein
MDSLSTRTIVAWLATVETVAIVETAVARALDSAMAQSNLVAEPWRARHWATTASFKGSNNNDLVGSVVG